MPNRRALRGDRSERKGHLVGGEWGPFPRRSLGCPVEGQHSMDMTGSEGGGDGWFGGGVAVVASRWPHMKYKEFKRDRVRCGFRKVLPARGRRSGWAQTGARSLQEARRVRAARAPLRGTALWAGAGGHTRLL